MAARRGARAAAGPAGPGRRGDRRWSTAPEAAAAAEAAAEVLFGGDPTSASAEALAVVAREVPTTRGARRSSTWRRPGRPCSSRTGLAASQGRRPPTARPGRRSRVNGRKARPRTTSVSAAGPARTAGSLLLSQGRSADLDADLVPEKSARPRLTVPHADADRLSLRLTEAAQHCWPSVPGGDSRAPTAPLAEARAAERACGSLKTEERTKKASAGDPRGLLGAEGRSTSNPSLCPSGSQPVRAPVGQRLGRSLNWLCNRHPASPGGSKISTESLILAQDERWRRA